MSSLALPHGTVDLDARELVGPTGRIALTAIECALLAYLADERHRAVSREELLERVWGYAEGVRSRTVDTTVQRLRAKVEADPDQPVVLLTVRGRGYQLRLDGPGPVASPPPLAPIPRLDDLVGRAAELRAVAAALHGGHRLVTLSGPSGVGKTSLARRALSEVADAGRRAVWFADASGAVTASDLLRLVGDALHLPHGHPVPVALGALGPAVGVVDDAQGLDDDALRTLSDLVRSTPALSLVLTSQRVLGLEGERRIEVEPLAPDDGVVLLRERLAALGLPTPPAAEMLALVERVEGLPLAIDLLAPLLDVTTVQVLLAREDLLAVSVDRPDRPARHRTLGAAVAASVAALDPAARDLLVALSVFAGPFPAEAAEAVAGASLTVLLALRRRSLLQRRPDGSLALYEAVRSWARTIGPPAATSERHARFLLAVDPPDRWQADLRRAVERGPPELRVDLARILLGVVHRRGPVDTLPPLLREAVTEELPPEGRAALRLVLAEACRTAGLADEATAHARTALSEAEALRDEGLAIRALGELGAAADQRGETDEAVTWGREALARAEEHGDPALLFRALSFLGSAVAYGRSPEGLPLHERAAEIALRLGNRVHAAICIANAGNVRATHGEFEAAMEAYDRALALAGEGNLRFSGVVQMNRANRLADLDRLDDAEAGLGEAERLLRRAGDQHYLLILEVRHAALDLRRGRRSRAVRRLVAVLDTPLHPGERIRAAVMLALATDDPSRLPEDLDHDPLVAAAAAVLAGAAIPEGTHPDIVDEIARCVRRA